MKSYHLKTNEPDPYGIFGFERFELNSIYVPERDVLVGFINWGFPRGKILNYSNIYTDRAQNIVEGNRDDIKGYIISEIELIPEIVDRIYNFGRKYNNSEIHITKPFDKSTERLVEILSGELKPRGILNFLDKFAEVMNVFDIDRPIPAI